MKLQTLLLTLTLSALLSLGTGCGITAPFCSTPSIDFKEASGPVLAWVESCSKNKEGGDGHWSAAFPEDGKKACEIVYNLKLTTNFQTISVEDRISFLCLKQLWVTLRKTERTSEGKETKKDGYLLIFVANGRSPGGTPTVVLEGMVLGPFCPLPDKSQPEYFDSCFWRSTEPPGD